MKQIPLTQGKFALVDDEDYESLASYKWYAINNHYTWYAVRFVGTKSIMMHRQIMGTPNRSILVDHKNHDGLDNQRENLRLATAGQNNANQKVKPHSSDYKGVSRRHRKWEARIAKDGKQIHLGTFLSEDEAAMVYDHAAQELFGEFALLNFPEHYAK